MPVRHWVLSQRGSGERTGLEQASRGLQSGHGEVKVVKDLLVP